MGAKSEYEVRRRARTLAAHERIARKLGTAASEWFRCTAMDCSLSRVSCGLQWRHWNGGTLKDIATSGRPAATCTRCPIGKLHARGVAAPLVQIVPKPSVHGSAGTATRTRPSYEQAFITAKVASGLRTRL